MTESWTTRVSRWGFNLFPAYRGSGGRVTYIAADWLEVHVSLDLNWRTRNYVGSIFGGSLYGAVDPIYMMMLIRALGRGYIVWDKAATIRFRRPGRSRLQAVFKLSAEEVQRIREAVAEHGRVEPEYHVEFRDAEGRVHAQFKKLLYVARPDAPPRVTSAPESPRDPETAA